jgi:tRNA G10  N-methylase Trm11
LFYATFIPGLQNVIADVIKERLSNVKIHKLLDGAVLFETQTSYDKLNFFCFNNIFAVINKRENRKEKRKNKKRGTDILEEYMRDVLSNVYTSDIIAGNSKDIKTFRIVVSCENVPVSIDVRLRTEAEKYIARLSGLKVNRSLPDTEFWFLYRTDSSAKERDFSIFMKRLTLRSSWEKTLHKGELPPPLAWTLCRLARLTHSDTVLDPFCGYGSIPQEALKHFHITRFIACDNNREAALYTKAKFQKRKKDDFVFYQDDFSNLLSFIAEKSIDAIITDPPWGHYKEIYKTDFYKKLFGIFEKLLKENGRVVMLCANRQRRCRIINSLTLADQREACAEDVDISDKLPPCFRIENSIPILLSGKKAVIYLLGVGSGE